VTFLKGYIYNMSLDFYSLSYYGYKLRSPLILGLAVNIVVSHQSPLRVLVNSPVEVVYTASDAAGNKKTCKRTYKVLGKWFVILGLY